jgi:hypothetical protein
MLATQKIYPTLTWTFGMGIPASFVMTYFPAAMYKTARSKLELAQIQPASRKLDPPINHPKNSRGFASHAKATAESTLENPTSSHPNTSIAQPGHPGNASLVNEAM